MMLIIKNGRIIDSANKRDKIANILIDNGKICTIAEAIAKMMINPARIFSLDKGTLSVGTDVDITLIDMELEKQVNASLFQSKARNTPFDGWTLKG